MNATLLVAKHLLVVLNSKEKQLSAIASFVEEDLLVWRQGRMTHPSTAAEVTEVFKNSIVTSPQRGIRFAPHPLWALDVIELSWLTYIKDGDSGLQTGAMVPLFRRRFWKVCSSFRDISLLSLHRKVSAGYRRGESTC